MSGQACLVTQRLGVYAEDGPDPDRLPDWVPIKGKVTFTPNIGSGQSFKVTDDAGTKTVPAVSYSAAIVNGELRHGDSVGIFLFAAGENSNPNRVTYTAEYSNMVAGTVPLRLRSVVFEAIPGGHVDLSDVTPVAATPGVGITRGEPGITPHIGQGGTWWIGSTDTGVIADATTAVPAAVGDVLAWVPVAAIESPPGSGLYTLTGEHLSLNESSAQSGIYHIGVS